MKRILVKTSDGSFTIKVEGMEEHYHSVHGAVQESRHVFIQNGLQYFHDAIAQKNEFNVLEIGFGTGLNALLSGLWAQDQGVKINYHGIEAFPLETELIQGLLYHQAIAGSNVKVLFNALHEKDWNETFELSKYFHFQKIHADIFNYLPEMKYDVLFYDAFGPRAQKEMWEFTLLERVTNCLKKPGLFVTYCAQGQLKRNLRNLGLEVSSPKGPPGKREMVVALRN